MSTHEEISDDEMLPNAEEEETQLEEEVEEDQDMESLQVQDPQQDPESDTGGAVEVQGPKPTKRQRKEPVVLEREPGKSIFPFARVQKIIKADKEIPIIAKEATFLISLATEEFIKRLIEEGHRSAQREKRTTVQHKDIASVVRRVDEFLFLEEIMPWTTNEPPPKRPKPQAGLKRSGPTMLDQFVGKNADSGAMEVVMNEDGTMVGGAGSDDDY